MRVTVVPDEANAPLVIDANTVLALPVSAQFLQSIRGRTGKVLDRMGVVQHPQLAQRSRLDVSSLMSHPTFTVAAAVRMGAAAITVL
jgi:hypothetical protein